MGAFRRSREGGRSSATSFSRRPEGGSGRRSSSEGRFGRSDVHREDRSESSGRFRSRERSFNRDAPAARFGARPRRDDDRPRQPLEMHEVICSKCGKATEVPFKPTGNKPVYCRECFRKNEEPFARDEPRGRSEHSSDEFAKIHKKLDKIMQALEID